MAFTESEINEIKWRELDLYNSLMYNIFTQELEPISWKAASRIQIRAALFFHLITEDLHETHKDLWIDYLHMIELIVAAQPKSNKRDTKLNHVIDHFHELDSFKIWENENDLKSRAALLYSVSDYIGHCIFESDPGDYPDIDLGKWMKVTKLIHDIAIS